MQRAKFFIESECLLSLLRGDGIVGITNLPEDALLTGVFMDTVTGNVYIDIVTNSGDYPSGRIYRVAESGFNVDLSNITPDEETIQDRLRAEGFLDRATKVQTLFKCLEEISRQHDVLKESIKTP